MILFLKIKDMPDPPLNEQKNILLKIACLFQPALKDSTCTIIFCTLLKNCRKSHDMSMYYFCLAFEVVIL